MSLTHTKIKKVLLGLGLSENSIEIYLALLQHGVSTVDQISTETGISRTNIYPYLRELKSNKLLLWEERKKGSALKPTSLLKIRKLVRTKLREAKAINSDFNILLPELRSLYSVNDASFRIQKYKGVEKCRAALESIYTEKFLPGGYCGEFVYEDLGKAWYEKHLINMYKKHKIQDHVIFSPDALKNFTYASLKSTRWYDEKCAHYKVYPELVLPNGLDVYILNDRVITAYNTPEPVCVVIISETYQKYELSLFNLLWKSAIDIKDYEFKK